jgi:hypothetical protein
MVSLGPPPLANTNGNAADRAILAPKVAPARAYPIFAHFLLFQIMFCSLVRALFSATLSVPSILLESFFILLFSLEKYFRV